MKRILAVAILIFVLCSAMPFSAVPASGGTAIAQAAFDSFSAGLFALQEQINLSAYSLTRDDLMSLLGQTLYDYPMLYYVDNSLRFSVDQANGTVINVLPKYNMTSSAKKEADAFIESVLGPVIGSIPEGLDDYEKAAYLYDYVCLNFQYSPDTNQIRDLYNMLKERHAVCDGYTKLLIELYKRAGLEAHGVTSDEANHSWTEVKIGGTWYMADATWGDPIPDMPGRAAHSAFLTSYSAIGSDHGSDAVMLFPATETKLDGLFWHTVDRPFAFLNGSAYCVSDRSIRSFDFATGEYREVFNIEDHWPASGNKYYVSAYSGLAAFNGSLIFNTNSGLKKLDPSTGKAETLVDFDDTRSAYGIYSAFDTIYVVFGDTPNLKTSEVKTYSLRKLFGIPDEIHVHTYGEPSFNWSEDLSSAAATFNCVEKDDSVTVDASVSLQTTPAGRGIAGKTVYTATVQFGGRTYTDVVEVTIEPLALIGDVNGDKTIDAADYILVKRHVLGTITLTGEQFVRANATAFLNGDEVVTTADYVMIRRAILKTIVIRQG